MKKMVAFVLLVMIALNAAVLLPKNEAKTEEQNCTAAKLSVAEMAKIKPGILPGLISL